jgi:hypothetical protein
MGVLAGNSRTEEHGAAAGMGVVALAGSVLLSRWALGWFGVAYGPIWTQRMIRLCCSAPLLAIANAPLFDTGQFAREGVALWLGMIAVSMFVKWEKAFERGAIGEMSFGSAIGTAMGGLIATAIAAVIAGRNHPERVMFIGAGMAGAASLILQATSWWWPRRSITPPWPAATPSPARSNAETVAVPAPPPVAPVAPAASWLDRHGFQFNYDIGRGAPDSGSAAASSGARDPRTRWMITRAFWALFSFAVMSGAIFAFVYAIIADPRDPHDKTAAIFACIALASSFTFAARKITERKRENFWQETLRPLLITVAMFGVGATITGIAREWHCHFYDYPCMDDEGRVGLITGLTVSSILLVALVALGGRRRPRVAPPFLTPLPAAPGSAPAQGPFASPQGPLAPPQVVGGGLEP